VITSTTPASAPPWQGRDVVFTFASETWDDAASRGLSMSRDRLAARLVDDPALRRVAIVNPFRSPIQRTAALLRSRRRPSHFARTNSRTLVQPIRARRDDPLDVDAIRSSYERFDAQLAMAVRRRGLREPVVITSNPFVAGFAPLAWAASVTFYVTDDWAAYPARERWWPAYRHAYAEVRRSGHAVAAVSAPLLERVAPTGPSAVIPNGIEPSEWSVPLETPAWFASLPRPRLLYVGNLQERIDVAALEDLAARRPDATIALVGPMLAPQHFESLRRRPNVVIHGRIGRREVVAVTRDADACLVPHLRTPLTEAMSPLKLYEYLAAGKPVAAVDLTPMRLDVVNLIRYDTGSGSLAEAVEEALRRGPVDEATRQRFLDQSSWHQRHSDLLRLAVRSP
jgi:glycosyltransferase involved in cell wall biosynthesis